MFKRHLITAPTGFTTIASIAGGGVGAEQLFVPNIINNVSFETTFDGMCSSGFGAPSGCTRDNAHAFAGTFGVKRVLPITAVDIGGSLDAPFYAGSPLASWTPNPAVGATEVDRLWTRFYFYLDNSIDGTFKFHQTYSQSYSDQFGGLYFDAGFLSTFFAPELVGGITHLTALSTLAGGWHYVEMDWWRNGDPSGNPSVAIWLDGVQYTVGLNALPAPATWVNGRIQFGTRGTSVKIGVAHWLGILNGSPANTIAGNVWVDRVAISTLGRIGP